MTQLKFEGMFEEVDKELQERAAKIKMTLDEDCGGTCVASKKDKTYSEVTQVTDTISFLTDYFKKYSPESVWGKWLQKQHHITVNIEAVATSMH